MILVIAFGSNPTLPPHRVFPPSPRVMFPLLKERWGGSITRVQQSFNHIRGAARWIPVQPLNWSRLPRSLRKKKKAGGGGGPHSPDFRCIIRPKPARWPADFVFCLDCSSFHHPLAAGQRHTERTRGSRGAGSPQGSPGLGGLSRLVAGSASSPSTPLNNAPFRSSSPTAVGAPAGFLPAGDQMAPLGASCRSLEGSPGAARSQGDPVRRWSRVWLSHGTAGPQVSRQIGSNSHAACGVWGESSPG